MTYKACGKLAVIAAFVSLFVATTLVAQNIDILVAPRDSGAYNTAVEQADDQTTFAERRIHRALNRAAKHLPDCGGCTVTIRIAGGSYDGKGGVGLWTMPDVAAPDGTLHIIGGYDDAFTERSPFDTPTLLVSADTRSGPVLSFVGRHHAIKELVISGLIFDSHPSNRYDADSRSILKGSSSTYPLLSLGYLTTDHLVIADNIFMNGAAGVGGPSLRTLSDDTRIEITNNVFFNSITPWTVAGGASDKMPSQIRIAGNSFVLNWPYNPDRTTSNPGALEIGNNYSTRQVLIENNLFAFNMGGAIFPQWDEDRGPPITIRNNLFWRNGLMFDSNSIDSGVVVGKFIGAGTHSIYSSEDLEDDFDWDVYDNISFDPGFYIVPPDLKAVQYGDEYRGADGDRVVERSRDDVPPELGDLAAQLAALTGAPADNTSTTDEPNGVQILGPDNAIANYAPALPYAEVGIPMPTHPEALSYGASSDRIWQPGDGS